jgi:hypothetical protein
MTRTKLFLGVIFFSLLIFDRSLAQDEKKPLKLSVSYSQINDLSPEVKATVKTKTGKKFEPAENIEVEFFFNEQSKENSIGKAKSNRKGISSIELPATIVSKLDSASPFKVIAVVSESKDFDGQSAEAEITKAKIDLVLSEVDSARKVSAKLLALKEGKWVEVPETEMKLFVRRIYSDLSLTENALTTNETGEASADFAFKTPIPGDANGNIIVGAKIEDNDNYGTVVAMKYAKWGTPMKIDRSFYERSLWAARDKTPIWLLVFPNIVIVTVWGLIFYMFFLIYRIRKVGLEQ